MYIKLTIQERLKDLRTERRLTLEQLSKETGLSKAALGNYESDDDREISPYSLMTLAKFYGVSLDYLLGLTEQREHPTYPVEELHLNDSMLDLLRSGRVNNRLLCEVATHALFSRLMTDMEIYVDQIASIRIKDMNTFLENMRVVISEKYAPDEEDLHGRTLEITQINEERYFLDIISDDLSNILNDIRVAHSQDAVSGFATTPLQDFENALKELSAIPGNAWERFSILFCKAFHIRYDRLSPELKRALVTIFRQSPDLRLAISQRGKSAKKHL